MKHCPGPSLGDLARTGHDEQATDLLCDLIRTLHAARPNASSLEPLATRFAPLTEATLTGDRARAAQLARVLLADPAPPVALHGDLHHDNVLASPRGSLAIDPKGVRGDPAYEPANAFRNPEGLGERLFDPDRPHRMAVQFSHRLGLPPQRLPSRAAAPCALSTRWSLKDGQDITEDLRLLPILRIAQAALSGRAFSFHICPNIPAGGPPSRFVSFTRNGETKDLRGTRSIWQSSPTCEVLKNP